jgi:hypothetical protein
MTARETGAVERVKCVEQRASGWIVRCPSGHEQSGRFATRAIARRAAADARSFCADCGGSRHVEIVGERWLDLPGFEGRYEVSDHGRVKSLRRRKSSGGLLTQFGRAGYLSVMLCVNGSGKIHLIHRLVLLAFVGPCPDGKEGAHKDGDPANNRLTNLYWATKKENAADKERHGKFRRAMRSLRRLSPAERAFIRDNRSMKRAELAAMLGVGVDTIRRHARATLERTRGQ